MTHSPLDSLKYHVTGAIERGEKQAIIAQAVTQPTIKTASDLKYYVEQSGNEPHFFDRKTMKFFGDRMSNYGVRKATIDTYSQNGVEVFELYRRKSVKHGLRDSAYFDCKTFQRVFSKKGE